MKCEIITDNCSNGRDSGRRLTTGPRMSRNTGNWIAWLIIALLSVASPLHATRIQDITQLGGQRTNMLTGLGLVYGLKGTGDGGDFTAAIRPLAAMLSKFDDSVTIAELNKVQNVAVVSITCQLPSTGALAGEKVNLYVTSIGASSSLKGGRLFISPLTGPIPNGGIFALAQGPVTLEEPSEPNVGIVYGGAVMEANVPVKYVHGGQIRLVLSAPSANWTTASIIAKTINDAEAQAGEQLAVAVDAKEVVVTIPLPERERPDAFIGRVQQLPLNLPATEARVNINLKTGTMVVTGDVEISPVMIVHKGMTITTVTPPPVPSPRAPVTNTHETVGLQTGTQGAARLQDLVNAFEQLKVPVADRIDIVKEIYNSGKLHAKLIEEQG